MTTERQGKSMLHQSITSVVLRGLGYGGVLMLMLCGFLITVLGFVELYLHNPVFAVFLVYGLWGGWYVWAHPLRTQPYTPIRDSDLKAGKPESL
jgi:hypothetical protein